MNEFDKKVNEVFAGRVVRKDLSKKIKEGINVPIYVLEYLLGMYCSTDDEDSTKEGVKQVKKILAENYVRPDEAEKVKFKITENGSYTVIDRVDVTVNSDGTVRATLMKESFLDELRREREEKQCKDSDKHFHS